MRVGRLANGTEFPINDWADYILEGMRERLRDYERLEAKLGGSITDPTSGENPGSMSFSGPDLETLRTALHDAKHAYELGRRLAEFESRDAALRQLYDPDHPRVLAQALGFSKKGEGATYIRSEKYDRRRMVCEYVWLTGRNPFRGGRFRMTKPTRDGHPIYPSPPVSAAEAIRLVAEEHGFPNPKACRKVLSREKSVIRSRNGRSPDDLMALVDDYNLPGENDC